MQTGDSLNRILYSFLATAVMVYLILRAIYVPLAHDEAETFFIYFVNGHFLPYQGWVSANNHFLNSFLGHLTYLTFGPSAWSIRLPNLVFFPLYAWSLYLLARNIQHTIIRWCLMLALLCIPLLTEFFALARGYGMGMAFLLAYIASYLKYLKDKTIRTYLSSAVLGLFMLLASLTCFYVFIITSAILLVDLIQNQQGRLQKLLIYGLFNVIPMVFFIVYTLHLGSINELVVGTLSGMYTETVAPMAFWLFGSDSIWLTSLFFIATAYILTSLLLRIRRGGFLQSINLTGDYFPLLLLGSLAIIAVNGYLLDIPFPRDRAALFLIPLLLFSVCLELDRAKWSLAPWLSILLLFFPLNFISTANLSHSHYWKTKRLNPAYYDYILEHSRNSDPTIGSMSLRETIWYHMIFSHEQKLNPVSIWHPETNSSSDFLIQTADVNPTIENEYDLVFEDAISGNNLYERREKLKRLPVADGSLDEYSGRDLYHDILDLTQSLEDPDSKVLLELNFQLTSSQIPMEFSLITEVKNSNAEVLSSQSIRLSRIKYHWDRAENTKLLIDLGTIHKPVFSLKSFILNNDEKALQLREGSYKIHILVH